jgi:hypothetical protein
MCKFSRGEKILREFVCFLKPPEMRSGTIGRRRTFEVHAEAVEVHCGRPSGETVANKLRDLHCDFATIQSLSHIVILWKVFPHSDKVFSLQGYFNCIHGPPNGACPVDVATIIPMALMRP